MNETMSLVMPLIAGLFLGAVFFGGLWWTVSRGLPSKSPAIWFFCSLWIRTITVVGGFYFVGQGDWRRLLVCLLGFLIARSAFSWHARKSNAVLSQVEEGAP